MRNTAKATWAMEVKTKDGHGYYSNTMLTYKEVHKAARVLKKRGIEVRTVQTRKSAAEEYKKRQDRNFKRFMNCHPEPTPMIEPTGWHL